MKSIAKIKEITENHPVMTMITTGILTGGMFIYIPGSAMKKLIGETFDYDYKIELI